MLLSLETDFLDYYDGGFDKQQKTPHPSFTRKSRRVTRDEMLRYLTTHQDWLLYPKVIPHGKVLSFEDSPIVVYTDPLSANGTGLRLLETSKAKEVYPDRYATLFLDNQASVTRHIVVGTKNYLFTRRSTNNWKSNVGDVHHSFIDSWTSLDFHPHFPLYSVSYLDLLGEKVALRINTAPRLSFMKQHLPSDDIIQQIRNFYNQ